MSEYRFYINIIYIHIYVFIPVTISLLFVRVQKFVTRAWRIMVLKIVLFVRYDYYCLVNVSFRSLLHRLLY